MRLMLLAFRRCYGSPPSLTESSVTYIMVLLRIIQALQLVVRFSGMIKNANFFSGFVVNRHITMAFQV